MNAPTRRRRRSSRTALVLGGGGFTGGVYQIGALRALDLLSSNRSVNQFDIYVGTSAGSLIASLVANGVTPEQMMRTVNDQFPSALPPIGREMLLRLNKTEFALKALKLPLHAVSVARNVASSLGSLSAVDLVLALGDALPSGIYTGAGIEDYLRKALAEDGRTDDFRLLQRELYLAATDLDTCERIVLGAEGWDDIPISAAVRASTALPMIYAPYRVRERELVDGGIVSTTNLDIAVEAGAKFIVVVNPLVPYVNDFSKTIPTLFGTRARRVSDMGFPKIGYQTFKLLAYQRLHEMAGHWKERYPGVDIVLIEPEPDDELMFQTNILNFASRVDVARHGFESVTLKLAKDYDELREVCRRHGIDISATRVRKVVRAFLRRAREDPRLAENPGADDRRPAAPVAGRLTAQPHGLAGRRAAAEPDGDLQLHAAGAAQLALGGLGELQRHGLPPGRRSCGSRGRRSCPWPSRWRAGCPRPGSRPRGAGPSPAPRAAWRGGPVTAKLLPVGPPLSPPFAPPPPPPDPLWPVTFSQSLATTSIGSACTVSVPKPQVTLSTSPSRASIVSLPAGSLHQ